MEIDGQLKNAILEVLKKNKPRPMSSSDELINRLPEACKNKKKVIDHLYYLRNKKIIRFREESSAYMRNVIPILFDVELIND